MVRTQEQIIEMMRERFGETPNDADLAFMEDVSDTIGSFDNQNLVTRDELEKQLKEKDNEWRQKYTERFYSGSPSGNEPDPSPANDPPKRLNFEDLFN